jgi:glycosyltransferase involved in cell wall biosynthesis
MICIVCSLPHYMAWAIQKFIEDSEEDVEVIAFYPSDPDAPITGAGKIIQKKVIWIKESEYRHLSDLLGRIPDVLVVSGWYEPCVNRFTREVRQNKGNVICMCDNLFEPSLAEIVKSIRFRLVLKRKFDGIMVPGLGGKKLMRFYGMPEERVATGLYTASPGIFYSVMPLLEREKKIIYVGRLDQRKNVMRVCEAFSRIYSKNSTWKLELYGRGILSNSLPQCNGITINDFTEGEQLANAYRSARCFILASLSEHWGVVVHEAALCGCALLLSDRVGAKEDLANEKNAVFFNPLSIHAIEESMKRVMSFSDQEWQVAQSESLRLASKISPSVFSNNLRSLIEKVLERKE